MSGGAALPVAFRSSREVVVVKPAGLSSEGPFSAGLSAGGSRAATDSALARVATAESWAEARLPHRLDRVTSGYLVVARDAATVAFHQQSMGSGQWLKGYVARVAGPVDAPSIIGTHRRYLRRVGQQSKVVRSGGDPAWLEVLAAAPAPGREGESHVAIRLITGRYHQIRAICADLGLPLVGDERYGGKPGPLWLEHARFSAPSAAGGMIDLFADRQGLRERLDESVFLALQRLSLPTSTRSPPRPEQAGPTPVQE